MSKSVIQVKNISKVYKINHELKAAPGTLTFKDSLRGIARKPIELVTGHQLKKEKFWALKDINFEVEQGEVLGIIGKNGSGKSTLLKLLSRIVEPTTGEIHMQGRVASLLEVGTGFHPELTGRENVYFNGSILGMKKKEIEAKFDEIVAFSEVEKFLDTPVKFYSSGMYVRLAFAVAAHLEPDILIVDEVLAVGDAAFQKKCLGKMQDVAGQGRTVLFVSHNMESVGSLCTSAILLQNGSIVEKGSVEKVTSVYMKDSHRQQMVYKASDLTHAEGFYEIKITGIRIKNQGKLTNQFNFGQALQLELILNKVISPGDNIRVDINVLNQIGTHIACFTNKLRFEKTRNSLEIVLPNLRFAPGDYMCNLTLFNKEDILQDRINDAFSFSVKGSDEFIQGAHDIVYGELEIS